MDPGQLPIRPAKNTDIKLQDKFAALSQRIPSCI
jgi:hypothetical protein